MWAGPESLSKIRGGGACVCYACTHVCVGGGGKGEGYIHAC